MSQANTAVHPVRVGTAGWSYKDWEGTVYPPHGSKFDHLSYLASFVDTIEVNSSFYRIPPPTHGKSWVRRVASNEDFRFTVKLFRGFTHEKELASADDAEAFRKFLDPIAEAGMLGALLIQYPWSFKASDEHFERLLSVAKLFDAYPRVVEVRHATLQTPEFLSLLDEHSLGFANIDQPLFSDSVKPSDIVTGPVGYIRLHGRNYQKWFSHEESWERYDYLYSEKELAPWVERARSMSREKDVFVIANNHFRGQAVVNSVEFKRALGQEAEVPPQLSVTYPERMG
jgi:uncharacterized protein YecE (DUF72 family)